MTTREICKRLIEIRDEAINYEGLNSDRQRLVANDLCDLILDIAALQDEPKEEDKEAVKKLMKNPSARFAYTLCDCGAKAYIKMRSRKDPLVAKCANCGRVLEVLAGSYIDGTEDPPPENLFNELANKETKETT